jgi:glycogen operon protein
MTEESWKDPIAKCFGMLLDGRAQESGIKQRATDETLLVVANSHHDVVNFTLPEVAEGRRWTRLFDTNDPKLHREHYEFGSIYQVTGRSMLLFLLEREESAAQPSPERKERQRKGESKK